MMKKISKIFLFMGMIALVALCPITGAVATDECEVPLSCTTKGGWTVTLMDDPTEVSPDTDIYEWRYSVQNRNGNTKGLNHINFSMPACCPDPLDISLSEPAVQEFLPPGTPDNTTGFGKGIKQIFVLKWTLNDPQDTDWFFNINSKDITKGTAGLKVGKKFELCEIAVPACPEPPPKFAQSAVNAMTYVSTVDGRLFKQMLDPTTQCPTMIWEILPCPDGVVSGESEEDITCNNGFYERELDFLPIEDVLTAKHGTFPGAEVISIANPGSGCGGAIVKSNDENSWFFCFLGRCWF
jgi:hypothetical protein